MIFTRIRVGKLLNLGQWEKTHVSSSLVLFPTTFIKNLCWQLRQLLSRNGCGRTVSPHPHAHSTLVDFTMAGEKWFPSLTQEIWLSHDCVEGSRTSNSCPSCCLFIHGQKQSCFSSCRTSIVCSFPHWDGLLPHAQEFSWFSSWYNELRAVRFHPQFPEWSHSRPQLHVLLTDRYGCVISVILMLRLELLFSPPCLLFSWDCVIRLLGVVLATRGPRMTQKLFSLFKLWQLN